MIEANNPDYFYFSEQVIYENKLPALPPNPSPSQSSIITVTTNASSIGTESIYNEEDDTNKDLSPVCLLVNSIVLIYSLFLTGLCCIYISTNRKTKRIARKRP